MGTQTCQRENQSNDNKTHLGNHKERVKHLLTSQQIHRHTLILYLHYPRNIAPVLESIQIIFQS